MRKITSTFLFLCVCSLAMAQSHGVTAKLVKVTDNTDSGDDITRFEYDDQNRVCKMSAESSYDNFTYVMEALYEDSRIVCSIGYPDNVVAGFEETIENDKVVKEAVYAEMDGMRIPITDYTYEYDDNDQLVKVTCVSGDESESHVVTYTWEDGNIVSAHAAGSEMTIDYTFTYDASHSGLALSQIFRSPTTMVHNDYEVSSMHPMFYGHNYGGKVCKDLLTGATRSGSASYTTSLSYTFDAAGRISTMAETEMNETEVSHFEWDETSAVAAPRTDMPAGVSIYSLDGSRRSSMHKGLNIIRMQDGTVRKVLTGQP